MKDTTFVSVHALFLSMAMLACSSLQTNPDPEKNSDQEAAAEPSSETEAAASDDATPEAGADAPVGTENSGNSEVSSSKNSIGGIVGAPTDPDSQKCSEASAELQGLKPQIQALSKECQVDSDCKYADFTTVGCENLVATSLPQLEAFEHYDEYSELRKKVQAHCTPSTAICDAFYPPLKCVSNTCLAAVP